MESSRNWFRSIALLFVISYGGSQDLQAQQTSLTDFLSSVSTKQLQVMMQNAETVYSYEDFRTGDICFKGNNCFQTEQFRIELLNNVFEFRTADGSIMYAQGQFVDNYSFVATNLYPGAEFVTGVSSNELPRSNYEVVKRNENLVLLKEAYAEIPNHEKEAGYLPGVQGDGNVIIKRYRYFAFADPVVYPIKRSVSAISDDFKCDKKSLKSFVKANKLNPKKDLELFRIVEQALELSE